MSGLSIAILDHGGTARCLFLGPLSHLRGVWVHGREKFRCGLSGDKLDKRTQLRVAAEGRFLQLNLDRCPERMRMGAHT